MISNPIVFLKHLGLGKSGIFFLLKLERNYGTYNIDMREIGEVETERFEHRLRAAAAPSL